MKHWLNEAFDKADENKPDHFWYQKDELYNGVRLDSHYKLLLFLYIVIIKTTSNDHVHYFHNYQNKFITSATETNPCTVHYWQSSSPMSLFAKPHSPTPVHQQHVYECVNQHYLYVSSP